MKTYRKKQNANRSHRCFLPLFLICLMICLAGSSCRTYLGSDDLSKQEYGEWMVIKRKSDCDLEKGVTLAVRGNTSLGFQFRIHSYDMREQEQSVYEYTGKRYYYVNTSNFIIQEPLDIIVLPIWITLCLPLDALYSLFNYDYHYRGENSPGLFYQIAYLPGIRYFFQPFFLAPNSLFLIIRMKDYREKNNSDPEHMTNKEIFESFVRSEEVYNSRTRIQIRHQDVYFPVIKTDDSNSTVKITAGDKTITKKVSSDGTLELDFSDIGPVAFDRQSSIKFNIHHGKWDMDWEVEAPATLDPVVIRDWNIFVDEQYDYRSRSFALTRLKPVLGETAYMDYLERLLDGKISKRTMSPMPTGITVVSQ